MKFSALEFDVHPAGFGLRAVVEFPNGYGASIVSGPYFYSQPDAPYELAVLHNGHITYDTPITSDVMGYQTQEEITNVPAQIEAL